MARRQRLQLEWQGFGLSKRGCSAEEYEDAFAGDPQAGRFAVADGAAESSFAALWARLLSDGFVEAAERPSRAAGWLASLQQCWAADVDARPLPWYAEIKCQEGAFATFLGLSLDCSDGQAGGRWRALAVGDSCLFHVRGDELTSVFPLTSSAEFSDSPALLGSRLGARTQLARQRQEHGSWKAGDRFLLMTDALALWFLEQCEAQKKPWRWIEALIRQPLPRDAFVAWIEQLRDVDGLRNDDVTMVRVATRATPPSRDSSQAATTLSRADGQWRSKNGSR